MAGDPPACTSDCLSGLPFRPRSASLQKRFNVFAQRRFHVGLRLLEGTCLNRNGRVPAAAIPAVISQPEFAFDTQTGCHPQAYGVIGHDYPPKRMVEDKRDHFP